MFPEKKKILFQSLLGFVLPSTELTPCRAKCWGQLPLETPRVQVKAIGGAGSDPLPIPYSPLHAPCPIQLPRNHRTTAVLRPVFSQCWAALCYL